MGGKPYSGLLNPPNPSVRIDYKGQRNFGIIAILYTYQACKTIFRPIRPIKVSVRMAYKGQRSFYGRIPGVIQKESVGVSVWGVPYGQIPEAIQRECGSESEWDVPYGWICVSK